jgi:hypothetical protein
MLLSTGLATGLSTIACLVSILAAYFAFQALKSAARGSARSVSIQKLTALEADLTETHQLIETLRDSLHKMRSREGMKRLRKERADAIPDAQSDPGAYKRHLRAQLTTAGKLNGRYHLGGG